jgi:hypothetical protein
MIPALRQQFLDRFFPAPSEAPPSPAPVTPLAEVTGAYRSALLEYNHQYQETAYRLTVLDQVLAVMSDGGGILVDGVHYVEIEPLLFQSETGGERLAFVRDKRGKITSMFRPPAYVKLAWYETGAFTRAMFYGWGVLWAGIALIWPLALLFYRRRGRLPADRLSRMGQWLLVPVGGLNVAFLLSLNRLFWLSAAAMRAWLALPLISAGLTAAALALVAMVWCRKRDAVLWRVYATLAALASVAFLLVLDAWNLLGFRLG